MSTTTAASATAGTRRRSISLAEAWREFWRWPSPWIMTAVLVPALVGRIALGDFGRSDLVTAAIMVAAQPFVEWVLHVTMLHMRPFEAFGRMIDPLFARMHREHHAEPRDTELVFIPTPVLVQVLVIALAVTFFAFSDVSSGLTFLVMLTIIGLVYEWTHYLIHTDYRPKTALYRILWRNHRLHHYKNENYWMALTNTTPDTLFGTNPDPSEVETSPTATNLLGS
ncbi:MAG: sterol desaturase family protein [Nitriliruptorales bacterium]|nr:sterol desaturase family protein [Nitriliruptorales bacterium]